MDSDVDVSVQQEKSPVTVADDDPFTVFYQAEYAGSVRLARALGVSPSASEDIVQEALVRVHERFGALESPAAYLRTIIVNLCRDWHRRQGRERRHLAAVRPATPVSLGARELLDVLARLPYRWRAVLVLRYWADWSEAEIAAALGCRPGTVKTLAVRGLGRLRKELSP
ncbi:MAG TPA: sigma factor-like helix-turn-helix DNA-binding protein [Acidimicrobiales bacterium]|nr:sigma factor-like helix-turn-helix DNA-binding protein [Acidimicrobiales bacterium]